MGASFRLLAFPHSRAGDGASKRYQSFFSNSNTAEDRKAGYQRLVDDYYSLATDFYEFGWGRSFHFAARRKRESHTDSLRRHEQRLGLQLGLAAGMRVADFGCGVGGPMREIARTFGCQITGLNINQYQIGKCDQYNEDAGLSGLCQTLCTDFLDVPLPDSSFDAAYAIEATCHAPDRRSVFREINRLLKPGGLFASYEWVLTDLFDAGNPEHVRLKAGIEEGDGLPDLVTDKTVVDALIASGFDVLQARDLASDCDPSTPWYRALEGRDWSLSSIPRTPLGGALTGAAVQVMERIGLAPAGTTDVSRILQKAGRSLVKAGRIGIFTPMFMIVGRKPG